MRDHETGRGPRRMSTPMKVLMFGGIFTTIALIKATEELGAASLPIWGLVLVGLYFLLRGPFGETILHAIAQGDRDPDALGTDPAVLHELDDLRAQVSELQERMDFTERLLAREREARPLSAGDRP